MRQHTAHPGTPVTDATEQPGTADQPGSDARVCPQCGEAARPIPPSVAFCWAAHELDVPGWSHTDGEPLCPVLGPDGYRPADPA